LKLRSLDQGVSGGNLLVAMKLGEEAVLVGTGSGGEALAKFLDFLGAGAAASNFRTTAGCGHAVLLG